MPTFPSGNPELDKAFDLLRTDPEKSLQICNDFLEKDSSNNLARSRKLFALQRLKDWPAALSVAKELIASNPEHSGHYHECACLHYRLGNYYEAIAQSNKTIEKDEDKWFGFYPYRLMAMCHAQLGNLPEAMQQADEVEKMQTHEWTPPIGPMPSGTIPQFRAYLTRLAGEAGKAPHDTEWL